MTITVKSKLTVKPKTLTLAHPVWVTHILLVYIFHKEQTTWYTETYVNLIKRDHILIKASIPESRPLMGLTQHAECTFFRRNSSILFKSLTLAMIWTESFCQCIDSKATLLIFTLRFRFAFGEGSLFSLNSFRQLPGNSGLKGGVGWYWTNSIIQDKVSKKIF